jgi:hypothetical protein
VNLAEYAAPTGLGICLVLGFYNDAAPMALDWRAHGRRPISRHAPLGLARKEFNKFKEAPIRLLNLQA